MGFIQHDNVVFASNDEIFVNIRHLPKGPNIRYFVLLWARIRLFMNFSLKGHEISVETEEFFSFPLTLKMSA